MPRLPFYMLLPTMIGGQTLICVNFFFVSLSIKELDNNQKDYEQGVGHDIVVTHCLGTRDSNG